MIKNLTKNAGTEPAAPVTRPSAQLESDEKAAESASEMLSPARAKLSVSAGSSVLSQPASVACT